MMWQQAVVINVASDRDDLAFSTRVRYTRAPTIMDHSMAAVGINASRIGPLRAVNKQMIRHRNSRVCLSGEADLKQIRFPIARLSAAASRRASSETRRRTVRRTADRTG